MTSIMPATRHDGLDALRLIARALPGGMAIGRWLRRMIDPELRAVQALRRKHGDRLFQPFPTTAEERYPELFDALSERLGHIAEPRILCFGCSSGAEVRALRRRLPHARITGIDANPRVIAKARLADTNPLSHYVVAAHVDTAERYDAVLALAVFRHGELEAAQPDNCAAILPFARFAEGTAMLDRCLAPGGWLAIWNAHFRFADAPVSDGYSVANFRMTLNGAQGLLYGADDRRICGGTYEAVLFRKRWQ